MIKHLLNLILAGVLSLFVLITITFFLVHSIPGGPFSPSEEKNVPPKVLELVNKKYGLDKPIHIQYITYMKNIAKGDLGISFKKTDTTVNDVIKRGFPVSARIGLLAVLVAVLIGVPLGILSAVYKNSWIDWFCRAFATIGISVPSFVISVFLLYFFVQKLKWFPGLGLSTWRHYFLPVAGLSLPPIAYIARMMRSSMLESMQQDYIRTSRAKGVPEFWVVSKHALKNSITPIVAYVGPLIAGLLTGSFIVERLFTIPGIGRFYVTSITERDYSVVLGITIFFGALLIACNIVVDFVYALIDPRIKFNK